ncbi:MAG: helix-turn-helix domain-containing protein [Novosphingobium sp.]|nr:helix-turn-helix domain-containing protein [Novosphingobium sp.]
MRTNGFADDSSYIWSADALDKPDHRHSFESASNIVHSQWRMHISAAAATAPALVMRRAFGDFMLTQVRSCPLEAVRDRPDIDASDSGHGCVLFLQSGRTVLRQGGNCSELQAGDLAFWTTSLPAQMDIIEPTTQLALLLPQEHLATACVDFQSLAGRRIDGRLSYAAILRSHLATLHQASDIDRPAMATILAATVHLFSACFRPEESRVDRLHSRAALVAEIKAYIADRICDPEISPFNIAAHFGFSTRYLHILFAQTGSTVVEWIRRRRLFLAHTALESTGASVTAVAMHFGFNDSSSFSRAFKAEFGVAPRSVKGRQNRLVH